MPNIIRSISKGSELKTYCEDMYEKNAIELVTFTIIVKTIKLLENQKK